MQIERDTRGRRAFLVALRVAALWLALSSRPAHAAETGPVLLLEPAALDGLALEALARLEGELRAAELTVLRRPLASDTELGPALERESRAQLAVFAFALAAQGAGLRLWIYDGGAQRGSVQDWSGADPHLPSVLAVQGVELVRARLIASARPVSAPAVSPPTVSPPAVSAPEDSKPFRPPRDRLQFGFELGLASNVEPRAHERGFAPLGRVFVGQRAPFGAEALGAALRIGASALGTDATLQAAAGGARVESSSLWTDLQLSLFPLAVCTPFATLGGGLARLRVRGHAEPGFYARNSTQYSALWGGGVGVLLHPLEHFGMNVEAQSWFAGAAARVRVDGAELARFGAPSLLFSATLVVTP